MSSEPGDGLSPVARWRNAVRDSDLDPSARLAGLVLSTYMGADANGAWPSKATIAAGCGFKSIRAVDAAINRLEEAGLLEVHRSSGHRPNVYRGIVQTPSPPAPLSHARDPLDYLN